MTKSSVLSEIICSNKKSIVDHAQVVCSRNIFFPSALLLVVGWWCFLIPNDQKSSHKFGKLTVDIIFVSNTKLRTPLHRQVGWAHWQRSPCHFLSPSPSSRCPLVVTRNTSKKHALKSLFFFPRLSKTTKSTFDVFFRALSSRKWKCTKFMWHCCGLNFENFVKMWALTRRHIGNEIAYCLAKLFDGGREILCEKTEGGGQFRPHRSSVERDTALVWKPDFNC